MFLIALGASTPTAAEEFQSGSSVSGPEATASASDFSVTLLAGYAIPIGIYYSVGAGLRAAYRIRGVHLGAGLIAQLGDGWEVAYPGRFGATQRYNNKDFLAVVDVGYAFKIPLGHYGATITPLLSAGALLVVLSTEGGIGSDAFNRVYPALGGGLSFQLHLSAHWAVGTEYRIYPLRTADLRFKDGTGSSHGYNPDLSLFYNAIFLEGSYQF